MELYIDTPYGKLYMHHGNFLYGVTPELIKIKNCKIFLYGHIHRKRIQKFNDTYVVCPGSTSLPRGNDCASYLIIEFDKNNEPIFTFKEL
jgi:predicted phosphodiesterase